MNELYVVRFKMLHFTLLFHVKIVFCNVKNILSIENELRKKKSVYFMMQLYDELHEK